MRKAINENPVVQVVVLGILGIFVAFMFMTRVMGGDDASSEAPPASSAPASSAPAAGTASSAGTATTIAPAPAAPSTGATPVVPGAGGEFEAGAGLPQSVVSAHESGNVVALLVVQRKGEADKGLLRQAAALQSRSDVSVFVAEAKDVARYSRIASGVDLDRVPALVVIEPKGQTSKGELPAATVTYGFRGADSLLQAINDARYTGRDLPYHPG